MSRAVIDQPGIRVFSIGLALAAFLGLALRSQISEDKVQKYLTPSIERLQTDFHVDYESARVSLSNWGMPIPSLVISHIRLSPKINRCQSSQIYADQLEIPVSFSMLFGAAKKIPRIRFKQIELRLADLDRCFSPKETTAATDQGPEKSEKTTTAEAGTAAQSAVAPRKIFSSSEQSALQEVNVERLKIVSDQRPDQPLLLKQLNFELLYSELKLSRILISAKLSGFKDARTDLYYLNSNLTAEFKSLSTDEIESTINVAGKLLDGDVSLFLHSFSSAKKVSFEMNLNQVSYKALLPLLQNTEALSLFDKTPVALSLQNKGEIQFENGLRVDAQISDFQTFIENGSVKIPDISLIYSDNSLRYLPFNVEVENFPLSKIKNIDSLRGPLESIDSLGTFTGQLSILNQKNILARGKVSGVTAIFSNRGRRDLQVIDQLDFDFTRKENEIRITASQFIINDKKNPGRLEIRHNTDSLATDGQFKISGAVLNAAVWEQFSFVEQTPVINLVWLYKKEKSTERHDVQLNFDKVSMPGIHFNKLSVDLVQTAAAEKKSQLSVSIRPVSFMTDQAIYENEVLRQLLPSDWQSSKIVLGSQKMNIRLSGENWREINFSLDAGLFVSGVARSEMRLDFRGRVSYNDGLSSVLNLQGRQLNRKFNLVSTADTGISVKEIN